MRQHVRAATGDTRQNPIRERLSDLGDKFVKVGVREVDQSLLSRAYRWLVEHDCSLIPADYEPRLERFREYDGTTVTEPEEILWLMFDGQLTFKGFQSAFIDPRPHTSAIRPAPQVLKQAGFPRLFLSAIGVTECDGVPAWEYAGAGTPWVWVKGGKEEQRTERLAQLAVMAARSMDRDLAPAGEIVYVRAFELCERANSADLYGQRSRWNVLQDSITCAVLLLDGIGDERSGPKELSTISQVIAARYRDMRCTLFASERGLSKWAGAYARPEQSQAQETARYIIAGLCGFQTGLTREATADLINKHVISLDKDTDR